MSINIEVCVSEKQSTTEKGDILEKLASDILLIQQYEVTDKIRVTGMELDVLAKHKVNSSTILVECKAHENALPADAISKLLGNVIIRNASSGWLMTTGPLTKDAEGARLEWEQRDISERQKLSFYTSDRIVESLVDARMITNPILIQEDARKEYSISEDITLMLITDAMYWIVPVVDQNTSFVTSVIVYNAKSAERIVEKETLDFIKSHKNSFSEFQWLSSFGKNEKKAAEGMAEIITNEYNNIVPVISGDDWIDYRPARPEDFVGRQSLIRDILNYFESVNVGSSSTRLFSIKAPSGMGKSSLVLKIASKLSSKKYSKKYFVYPVDVRTAVSSRYVEMAFMSCIEKADECGFTDVKNRTVEITNINQYIDSLSIQNTLEYLKNNNKTIVLIFDQFEELFSKKELFSLFDNFRVLCNKVDALQGPIILGFAWKTDLTIPADHPAYYMWSNLSDRRKEFELVQFKNSEIKSAINIFGKQLGEGINPILRSYLTKQCQGYPWLLKKLCIHVFKLIDEGSTQDSVIGHKLNIVELFERDISGLTPDQHACLKEIAQNSPSDYFSIADVYGSDMVQTLVNNRLVIRRASKLTLYWDIFRDYVLNKSIPSLVHEYIPQLQPISVYNVIKKLINSPGLTVDDLAKKLNKNSATIENTTIDLVMFGIARKENGLVILLYHTEDELVQYLQAFFKKHIIYQRMLMLDRSGFDYKIFTSTFNDVYSDSNFSNKTKTSYCSKLYSWFTNLGLFVSENGRDYALLTPSYKHVGILGMNKTQKRSRYNSVSNNLFFGQTSPEKMEELYQVISNGNNYYNELLSSGYRNAIEVLSSVSAVHKDNEMVYITKTINQIYLDIAKTDTVILTAQLLVKSPYIHGIEVGHALSEKFNRNWTESSERRYGGALLRWTKYLKNKGVQIIAEE